MARRGGRDATKRASGRSQPARARSGRPGKPKVCQFCASRTEWVDYKDVNTLRRLMSDRGKIKARRVTGTCRQHQRDVAVAIKTARELALLPYALSPNAEKSGRDGRSREGRPAVIPAAQDPTPPTGGNGSDPVEVDAQVDEGEANDEAAAAGDPSLTS